MNSGNPLPPPQSVKKIAEVTIVTMSGRVSTTEYLLLNATTKWTDSQFCIHKTLSQLKSTDKDFRRAKVPIVNKLGHGHKCKNILM
uniref:Uncharacterized protein n=1 Tax=Arion vulgaris TaxID=1028688 RepID=A0A0B7AU54_9EUPU